MAHVLKVLVHSGVAPLGGVFRLVGGGIPLREYVGPSSLLSILLQSNEGSGVSQWQTAIITGCSC